MTLTYYSDDDLFHELRSRGHVIQSLSKEDIINIEKQLWDVYGPNLEPQNLLSDEDVTEIIDTLNTMMSKDSVSLGYVTHKIIEFIQHKYPKIAKELFD